MTGCDGLTTARIAKNSQLLVLMLALISCAQTPAVDSAPAQVTGDPTPTSSAETTRLPINQTASPVPVDTACMGTAAGDNARPPTPLLMLDGASVPGTVGGTHRWVEGGVMATGNGGIPMPDQIPAVFAGSGATLRLVFPCWG